MINVEQFTKSELLEALERAKHAHSWGDRCLSVELGEVLVAWSDEGYEGIESEDGDIEVSILEDIGDAAQSYLEQLEGNRTFSDFALDLLS
mgnify:CR=1 FL=1